MQPPLPASPVPQGQDPTRYLLDLKNITKEEIDGLIENISKLLPNANTPGQHNNVYVKSACGHQALNISNNDLSTEEPNTAACRPKTPQKVCVLDGCGKSSTYLVKDYEILQIAKNLLAKLGELSKLKASNYEGTVDITALYVFGLTKRKVYILDCGHSMTLNKLGNFIGKVENSEAPVNLAGKKVRCSIDYCPSEHLTRAVPNQTYRKISALISNLFDMQQKRITTQINTLPSDNALGLNTILTGSLEKKLHEIVSVINLRNPSANDLAEMKQWLKKVMELQDVAYATRLISTLLHKFLRSGSGQSLEWFFRETSKASPTITANCNSQVVEFLLVGTESIDQNNLSHKINFLLPLLVSSFKYNRLNNHPNETVAIITALIHPTLIYTYTVDQLRLINQIATVPCVQDRFCGSVEGQEGYIQLVAKQLQSILIEYPEHAPIQTLASRYPHILTQFSDLLDPQGFSTHHYYTWLISNLSYERFTHLPAGLKQILVYRLLNITPQASVFDLMLLKHHRFLLSTYKDSMNPDRSVQLRNWYLRCLKIAGDPRAVMPYFLGDLEKLKNEILKILIDNPFDRMLIERSWLQFFACSNDPGALQAAEQLIRIFVQDYANDNNGRHKVVAETLFNDIFQEIINHREDNPSYGLYVLRLRMLYRGCLEANAKSPAKQKEYTLKLYSMITNPRIRNLIVPSDEIKAELIHWIEIINEYSPTLAKEIFAKAIKEGFLQAPKPVESESKSVLP